MKTETFSLVNILQKIKYSDISRIELNFLIQKSFRIANSFVSSKFKNNLQFLSSETLSVKDIAMNSIIPLFTKNNNGELGLKITIDKWNDELKTESDCNFFLSKIIWRRIDQTVTGILKERDPIYEKILKTLNVCINNTNLKKVRYFGTVLVLEESVSQVGGIIIDETEFNLLPERLFSYKQAQLFNKVFKYIKDNSNCYPAIPLNLLVKRVKNSYLVELDRTSVATQNSFEEISVQEIVEEGLIDVKQKLDVYYVSRSKIKQNEANYIYLAFSNISKDMLNGGMQDSLYYYLKDFNQSLTKDLFYTKYHHIMNYLLTRFKNNIYENISL